MDRTITKIKLTLSHDLRASPLGRSLGGDGLLSTCVADLAGDGKPRLVFSYSWGSGIHRSIVGVWTGGTSWVDAMPELKDYDLFLQRIDDNHVEVLYGEFGSFNDKFNRLGTFGTVHFAADGTKPHLEIILSQGLPKDVLQRIWK